MAKSKGGQRSEEDIVEVFGERNGKACVPAVSVYRRKLIFASTGRVDTPASIPKTTSGHDLQDGRVPYFTTSTQRIPFTGYYLDAY
jgi:hypothetical protein